MKKFVHRSTQLLTSIMLKKNKEMVLPIYTKQERRGFKPALIKLQNWLKENEDLKGTEYYLNVEAEAVVMYEIINDL